MRQTYKTIPGDMCDFHEFYDSTAIGLPDGARIVEVGVADGHSLIYMAEKMDSLGKDFHIYGIDSLAYGGTEQANTIMRNIVKSELAEHITFLQMSSLDASCKWPDAWAHFVFLDSSHTYEQTKAEVRLWHHKVMHGYFLAGHDYDEHPEVKKALAEVAPGHGYAQTRENKGVWTIRKGVTHVN